MAYTVMLSESQKKRLGVALNEAALLGVEVDQVNCTAAVTLAPVSAPHGSDPRILLLLSGVRRVASSLRKGRWDDANAEVESFRLTDLFSVVRDFESQFIYGWEFFDRHETELSRWGDRLSLDWHAETAEGSQSLLLFQESAAGPSRILDLLIWFDHLTIRDSEGQTMPIDDFALASEQWWDSFHEDGEAREGPDLRGLSNLPAT